MKKLFLAVAAAAVLLLPISAHASAKNGFYVAPKFVLSIQNSEAKHYAEAMGIYESYPSQDTTDTNAGFAVAVGYDFAPKFNLPIRAEVEYGAYGDASINFLVDPRSGFNLKSKVEIKTLMLNLYWDITEFYGFKPYVGAGVGIAFVDTDLKYTAPNFGTLLSGSNKETVFAWQLGAGISYAFNDTFSADLGYRFLMTGDGKAHGEKISDIFGLSFSQADWFKVDSKKNYMHQFMLGLRMTF